MATGLVIWKRGQVTRPTPELAPNATLQRHRTRLQDIRRHRFNEHVYPSVFLLDFGSISVYRKAVWATGIEPAPTVWPNRIMCNAIPTEHSCLLGILEIEIIFYHVLVTKTRPKQTPNTNVVVTLYVVSRRWIPIDLTCTSLYKNA